MDKEKKRFAIIEAAINQFTITGFDNTTMGDIAKSAGIGKSTIYEYFKSKEELLQQCALCVIEYYNTEFEKIFSIEGTLKDKIIKYLEFNKELSVKVFGAINMLKQSSPSVLFNMSNIIEQEKKFIENKVISVIEIAVEKGEIRSDISVASIAIFIEMAVVQIVTSDMMNEQNREIISDIITLIYDGIGI